ncbi:MAG TPA: hypothetical protein VGT40_07480 [Methylomirabilota bacterium]|jgi:hypothetical protein|nr:hypothetical protein [Methylomirabilota bacterium]
MNAVTRRTLLLAFALLSLGACASEPDKQWYKAGGNYTVAEFQRDEVACTKNRVLDEACLKGRGWLPLTVDEKKATPPQAAPGTKGVRY